MISLAIQFAVERVVKHIFILHYGQILVYLKIPLHCYHLWEKLTTGRDYRNAPRYVPLSFDLFKSRWIYVK